MQKAYGTQLAFECYRRFVSEAGSERECAGLRSGELTNAKTAFELLADLEHEFRIPRHPVRLGITAWQYERHLRETRRKSRSATNPLARRAAYWVDRTTNHRLHERS